MPSRLLVFLLSACLLVAKVSGQTNGQADAFIKHKFKPIMLSLSNDGRVIKTSFREIDVVDYRADTSRLGFSFDRGTGHKVLLLQPGTGTAVKSFLNKGYTNPSTAHTLLVVIRKFWISEITAKEQEHAFTGKPHTTRICFRAEAYLKDGEAYIPYGYLDTTITSAKHPLHVTPFRIPDLLAAFMEKMNGVDTEKALKTKRRVSYAFIDSFSNRKFSYAMNKAETLQKGVYASIDDFRNNRPTITDYVIEQDKGTLSLYIKDEDGKPYFSRKIWGYCDGEQSFVMINGNLYPVLRQQHAFHVFGAKDYTIKTTRIPIFLLYPVGGYIAGSVPVSQKVIMTLRMYTLDPETGEID